MALSKATLRTLVKQALGNRTATTGTTIDNTWYDDRVYSAYRRLCTYQGVINMPGSVGPQSRRLQFFELFRRDTRTLSTALATNFVTPTASNVVYVSDVYDRDNNRGLKLMAEREMRSLDPDATGTPTRFMPAGENGVIGYYIDKRPTVAADEIDVYEYSYTYPAALALDATEPVIPAEWHIPIVYGAVSEAAQLLLIPEVAAEYEAKFVGYIAERRSPVEDADYAGRAGERGHVPIGRAWSIR